jgi:hypothetical protein
MRTVSRLLLLLLLDLQSSPTVPSTLLLFALSKLCRPIKRILSQLNVYRRPTHSILMVDLGGFAPPSRTLFSLYLPFRYLQQFYYSIITLILCYVKCFSTIYHFYKNLYVQLMYLCSLQFSLRKLKVFHFLLP